MLDLICPSVHAHLSSPSTVEQEQIQKKTFTNWVNAQLAKVSVWVCVHMSHSLEKALVFRGNVAL